MSRQSSMSTTPCPASFRRHDANTAKVDTDELTSNVEFTRAFPPLSPPHTSSPRGDFDASIPPATSSLFRHGRPKRRQPSMPFAIHEDEPRTLTSTRDANERGRTQSSACVGPNGISRPAKRCAVKIKPKASAQAGRDIQTQLQIPPHAAAPTAGNSRAQAKLVADRRSSNVPEASSVADDKGLQMQMAARVPTHVPRLRPQAAKRFTVPVEPSLCTTARCVGQVVSDETQYSDTSIKYQKREQTPGGKEETLETDATRIISKPSPAKRKPAAARRRDTLYIPSDETTMPSMYMGIFSPLKDFQSGSADGVHVTGGRRHEKDGQTTEGCMELTGIAARMAEKRGIRQPLPTSTTKRGPLTAIEQRFQDPALMVEDRLGQGGGKENLPPGWQVVEECEKKGVSMGQDRKPVIRISKEGQPPPPTTCAHTRTKSQTHHRAAWNGGSRLWQSQPASTDSSRGTKSTTTSETSKAAGALNVPSRIVSPDVHAAPLVRRYAVLSEHILNSSLYEENWLDHQEIAMTQLLNQLFRSKLPDPCLSNKTQVRRTLVELYNDSAMTVLHRRLQAAVLHGPLSVPHDHLTYGSTMGTDLGRRKSFTNLWVETYNLDVLEPALEVVVGRRVVGEERRSLSGSAPPKPKSRHKSVVDLICTFLIHNEDGRQSKQKNQVHTWAYQRTLLRSLMLLKLLDRLSSSSDIDGVSLFNNHSSYASSAAVLEALVQMLNPAVGDAPRKLRHVGFEVVYAHNPLQGFDWHVQNLAIDLRDGVRLTRLVEMLLYSASSGTDPSWNNLVDGDQTEADAVISMSEGETIGVRLVEEWPLCRHLKIPCPSRTAKLWNLRIALGALEHVHGINTAVQGIVAEDIVDGYREKTIRLLWALVSKWGLAGLLDLDDVEWETRRLRRPPLQVKTRGRDQKAIDVEVSVEHGEDSSWCTCRHRHRHLLHTSVRGINDTNGVAHPFDGPRCDGTHRIALEQWVKAVANAQGISVDNFSTSFSDGKIFEAVLNVYEPFLLPTSVPTDLDAVVCNEIGPGATDPETPGSRPTQDGRRAASLHKRLTKLGCSPQFACLFAPHRHTQGTDVGRGNGPHIFDPDFVYAAVAFLCARLLPPTKTGRSAFVIQTAWRRHWTKVVTARKVQKKRVATACMAAVEGRFSVPNEPTMSTLPTASVQLNSTTTTDAVRTGMAMTSNSASEDEADDGTSVVVRPPAPKVHFSGPASGLASTISAETKADTGADAGDDPVSAVSVIGTNVDKIQANVNCRFDEGDSKAEVCVTGTDEEKEDVGDVWLTLGV